MVLQIFTGSDREILLAPRTMGMGESRIGNNSLDRRLGPDTALDGFPPHRDPAYPDDTLLGHRGMAGEVELLKACMDPIATKPDGQCGRCWVLTASH